MGADGGVDALDPQGAELTLAGLAVAGRVLVGLVDGLGRGAEVAAAGAVIAFRGLEHLLVTGVSGRATFNSGHGSGLLSVRRACNP